MTPQQLADIATRNAILMRELADPLLSFVADLCDRYQDLEITSTAREIADQARAMAENVCAERKRSGRLTWIADTYAPSTAARTLNTWVVNHGNASEPDMVAAFIGIMEKQPPAELRKLSKHIVLRAIDGECVDDKAEAVDFKPIAGTYGDVICAVIDAWALKNGARFLKKEGGEIRWHLQL